MSHDHHGHGLAEMLDLDAQILEPAMREVREDIAGLADGPVCSILDLGAGTGTGTFGLLQHFSEARAIAVDASADMLAHLMGRARELGLADRVTTVAADLDEGVPTVEPVDLVWAAASLHHLADPERTLAQIVDVVRPGGLLAVSETSGLPRFIPDDAPGGTVEARAHALLTGDRAGDMPTMGSDWGPRLERAGLVVELHRPITVEVDDSTRPLVARYAAAALPQILAAVSDRLDESERQAFEELIEGVGERDDLEVRSERRLWMARRHP